MDLAEYIKASQDDSNAFWRLESGEMLNLLDEATETIDSMRNAVRDVCDFGIFDVGKTFGKITVRGIGALSRIVTESGGEG